MLHKVPRKRRVELLSDLSVAGLAVNNSSVTQPENSSALFDGLPIMKGYKCCEPGCGFISVNKDNIRKHCYAVHSCSLGLRRRKKKRREGEEREERR